mmetsp:Transcript_12846/g.26058  ORF Transcript_12846/g.26058 Transcript_12846/m.26058 type:complete len:403 (-) Transcript_12846:1059-2267(-)|eukprot:CAMPEP_0184684468 /NCGR_PEP_ID=MMETSP0312-20130426/15419_1 /TAXON_ID=31354 /ORGANISM="Compsopogon coeruleus, Strain SAG 36.94" /LENGTH=402 /DNA_ID=CAMNT_0027137667 /DNA_START=19 /DNA_END=1227 /DNA_ORIENTATION=-
MEVMGYVSNSWVKGGLRGWARWNTVEGLGSASEVGRRRWSVVRSGLVDGGVVGVVAAQERRIGAAALDWSKLGFQYLPTNGFVRYTWRDGQWDAGVFQSDPYISLHIGATVLHYGQSCFEGLKAFAGKDERVRLFRPDENAKRMATSTARLCMPTVPESMFLEAVKWAVRENLEYVPPYGTGSSMYVRPLMFGSGPKIGLAPAEEYTFLVVVMPVGDYYKGGLAPVTAIVTHDYDRAAPRGVGQAKVGANYAADLLPHMQSIKAGYPINLYLDAIHHNYVEEFGTSNFIALKGNKYLTPDSQSVLRSITNMSLMTLAEELGFSVEKRPISIDEVEQFDEVAACGTAVIITPVTRIVFKDRVLKIGGNPDGVPPTVNEMYRRVRGIQFGDIEDKYGWTFDVQQ